MHHIGIIFGLFVAQLWINAADMALSPADIPVLSHFGQPCTYEGRTFVSNQVPSRAQMNREIASCAAKGAPEFLIGDTDFPQYFFHRLGLKRGDYRQIVVASQHVPWKTWVTSSDIAVYVRSDVYRTLPHA